jgi:RecA/RadA recombinase
VCSIQLTVDVSIPEPLGGVGGEAVYIDTEGSFVVERVAEIATAAVHHLNTVDHEHTCDDQVRQAARDVSLEKVLASIHLFRCHDYLELLATVNILSEFITSRPQVGKILAAVNNAIAVSLRNICRQRRLNRILFVFDVNPLSYYSYMLRQFRHHTKCIYIHTYMYSLSIVAIYS